MGKVRKEIVSDLKTITNKGFKIALQKSLILGKFCLTEQFFFGIGLFAPTFKVQCPNFLDFRNPWGKVEEANDLRFENFCYKRV